MPAIMTHDFFGRDAYSGVSAQLLLSTPEERDAFLLGNQGPDPLFYLVADPRVGEQNRIGNVMHHVRPARLICALRDALSMLGSSERKVGEAYAAGFLCHYLLDRSVHPLVFSSEYGICDAGVDGLDRRDGSEVHAEIERDIDEMVLYMKCHQTVRTYRPYREVLCGSDEVLATIDKLYFYMGLWTYSCTLDLDCYTRAVKSFRRVQRLFYTPSLAKARILAPVEKAFGHKRYSLYRAMAHRDRAESVSDFGNDEHRLWENPFTREVLTDSFWDLYEEALDQVFEAVNRFLVPSFDLADAERLTHNLNFSGQPTSMNDLDAPEEPKPQMRG